MSKSVYLLVPLAPLVALICLVVFLYERLLQNDSERAETRFPVSKAWKRTIESINFIATFPLVILGPVRSCLNPILTLITLPFYGFQPFLRICLWEPIFKELVPYLYGWWNDKTYHTADLGPRQIRVMEVLPGASVENIKVKLITINLDHDQFKALSYTWGGHLTLRRIITINNRSFLVTDTVLRFLREFRHPTEARRIWIDAICINQSNIDDKRAQISIMGDIYRRAQEVIIWLGAAPAEFQSVVEAVQELAPPSEPGRVDYTNFRSDNWHQPLRNILKRRWWSRCWTVQEVALGDRVIVQTGSHKLSWDRLSAFLRTEQIQTTIGVDSKVLEFVHNIYQFKSSTPNPPPRWLDYAIQFRHRDAGRPKDKVFGFQGLLRPSDSNEPKLDYGKRDVEIFAHFASFYMHRDQSLALLGLAEAHSDLECSWAVDWSMLTSPQYNEDPFFSNAVDPRDHVNPLWTGGLIPSAVSRWRKYSAAAGRRHSITSPPTRESEDGDRLPSAIRKDSENMLRQEDGWNKLRLQGYQVDTIDRVGDIFDDIGAEFTLPKWFSMASEPVASLTDLADNWRTSALAHTLVADSYNDDILTTTTTNTLNTEQLQAARRNLWLRLMGHHCWKRRFFVTTGGRFGLGPTDTGRDHIVVVAFGSDVPIVLDSLPWYGYTFVGQAYLDGVMDYEGGAAGLDRDVASGKVRPIEFVIG